MLMRQLVPLAPPLLLLCAASQAAAQDRGTIYITVRCADGASALSGECPEDMTPEQRRQAEAREAQRQAERREQERIRAAAEAERRVMAQQVMAQHKMARHREQEALRLVQMRQAAEAARNPIRRNLNPLSCGYNPPPGTPRPPRPPGSTCQQ